MEIIIQQKFLMFIIKNEKKIIVEKWSKLKKIRVNIGIFLITQKNKTYKLLTNKQRKHTIKIQSLALKDSEC